MSVNQVVMSGVSGAGRAADSSEPSGAVYALEAPLTPGGLMIPTVALSQAERGTGASMIIPVKRDLYRAALEALRGRVLLAVFLALLFGAAGAAVGWKWGGVVYKSEGLVRISYVKDAIITETDLTAPIRMYDAYLRSEQQTMMSRPVLGAAVRGPLWQMTGRGSSDQVIADVAKGLSVDRVAQTELLRVSFVDARPAVAEAAVRSVIRAYSEEYWKQEKERHRRRVEVLAGQEQAASKELAELEGRIREIESSGFEQALSLAYQRAANYQSKLDDIRVGIALAEKADPAKVLRLLTIEQIAQASPVVQEALSEKRRQESELTRLGDQGYGKDYPAVQRASTALVRANTDLERLAEDFRSQRAAAADLGAQAQRLWGQYGRPLEQLRAEQPELQRMYEQTSTELNALNAKRLELQSLKRRSAKVEETYAEHSNRRKKLEVESNTGSRLEVLSEGATPMSPFRDTRMKFGAMGMALAAFLPVGLLMLLGLSRPRYQFSEEAAGAGNEGGVALLGVVPELPARVSDDCQASDAAHCVHRIRVMLDSAWNVGAGRVYLISSASPGEGKTSLAVALALSYAFSGERTLLIDADMSGRRVTRGFGAMNRPGLREALEKGRLEIRNAMGGLSVLTTGVSDPMDSCRVSSPAMRRILGELRRHFDTILIDSGPILGSVEASALASVVDATLFVVARGQKPHLARRGIEQVRAVGGRVAGMVFNRAKMKDFHTGFQSSSLRSEELDQEMRARFIRPENPSQFGPLVQSVASFMPSATEQEVEEAGSVGR